MPLGVNDWGIWAARLVISVIATAIVAWGVAFTVSDYVVKASLLGYDKNVDTLNWNVDRVDEMVRSLDDRFGESREGVLQEIAELQKSNALLEQNLVSRFDAVLTRMDTTNEALSSLARSLSQTAQEISALDSRQREFESLVLKTMLRTTDPASFKPNWYEGWGFDSEQASLLTLDNKDIRATLSHYYKKN